MSGDPTQPQMTLDEALRIVAEGIEREPDGALRLVRALSPQGQVSLMIARRQLERAERRAQRGRR